KTRVQRYRDRGDDIVATRYDNAEAVLDAFALKPFSEGPLDGTDRLLISHERIKEKAKFRAFTATADAGYPSGDPNRLVVMVAADLQRDRGAFTKREPMDVLIAEFTRTPDRDGQEAWQFAQLGYRQDSKPIQYFTAEELGHHTTNQLLNSARELMVEGRLMQQERSEERKAGSTLLLGGALGLIKDTMAFRYTAPYDQAPAAQCDPTAAATHRRKPAA
ncbi:MAG: hypothetical protein AAF213_09835, partial [Pseudomonadota bacterium]